MNIVIDNIIKLVIRNPRIMETKFFEKIMLVFPAQIAKRYDKTVGNKENYDMPFNEGLKYLNFDADFNGEALDLCTGTGFASLALATNFPNARITAIDQSQAMLNVAIEKAVSKGIHNIEFKKEVASNLSSEDNTFDLVTVSNAPFYFDEVVRVLKPSGLYLIVLSFGGKAIVESKKRIIEYLEQYDLQLLEIKKIEDGAFILSRLDMN